VTERDDYFARIESRIHRDTNESRRIGIAGAGQMGAQLAQILARHGVLHIALFDGDRFEPQNAVRHILPLAYLWTNKAEGTASWLNANVPGMNAIGIPRNLDETMTDLEIDRALQSVQVLIIATDDLVAQRRLARRARAMGIVAIVPGLFPEGGGEIFVELGYATGCTECWYAFRPTHARLRDAAITPAQDKAVLAYASYLTLAVIDPDSQWAEELVPEPGSDRSPQLFLVRDGAAVRRAVVTPREGCQGCTVAPSQLNGVEAPTAQWGSAQGGSRPPSAGWPFALDPTAGPPRIDSLEVSARLVGEGFPVTVSWRTNNTTRVELDGVAHPPSGSVVLGVPSSGVFTLRAVNPFAEVTAQTPFIRSIPLPRVQQITVAAMPHVPPVRFLPVPPSVSWSRDADRWPPDPPETSIGGRGPS
jgi:hypothetical protein